MKHAGLHRLVNGRGVGPKGFLGGLSVATGQCLQVSLLESSDPGLVGPVPATASFTHAGSPGCRSCIGHSKTVLMVLRSNLCSGQIQGRLEYMRTKGCQCSPWTLWERVLAHRALAEKEEPGKSKEGQQGFRDPGPREVFSGLGPGPCRLTMRPPVPRGDQVARDRDNATRERSGPEDWRGRGEVSRSNRFAWTGLWTVWTLWKWSDSRGSKNACCPGSDWGWAGWGDASDPPRR